MAIDQTAAPAPATFTIQGRQVRLPVEVRDATAAVAFYLVPARAAQALIAATGLRAAQVLPGRTLCTIGTMVYRDGDLGPYHEVAITFFVRKAGARSLPLVGGLVGVLRGSLGAYIHHLPVDAEFSRDAGCTIWGFPKFLAEIAVSEHGAEQTSTLWVDGQHVLSQTVRMGGGRSFSDRPQVSYAYRDGALHRTPSTMSARDVGARRGGARLELGTHPIAEELRRLGLPKGALFSTFAGKLTGAFYAPERLGHR